MVDPWDRRPTQGRFSLRGPVAGVAATVAGGWAGTLRNLLDELGARALLVGALAVLVVVVVGASSGRLRRWQASVAAVAVVLIALAVAPDGSHRSVLVVGASSLIAAAAFSVGSASGPRLLGLPLLVAGGAVWVGAPPSSGPGSAGYDRAGLLCAALLVISALVVWWSVANPLSAAEAEGRVGRMIGAIGRAVAMVCVAVVALPVLYLPGALLRLWRRRPGRPERTSSWVDRADAAGVQDPRWPFIAPPAAVRRRRLALGGVAVLVCVAVLGYSTWSSAPETPGPAGRDEDEQMTRFSELPAYAGSAWADDVQREQVEVASTLVEDDLLGAVVGDFDGRFTVVHDGVRRSVESTCDCERRTVWIVGGSFAFGLGQRDEATIASALVRAAEGDGMALDVVNLAVPGWTVEQEARAIEARLSEHGAPDLVISITGYNDVVAGTILSALGRFDPDEPLFLDQRDIDDLLEADRLEQVDVEELASEILATTRRSRARMEAAVEAAGSQVRFFLQPDALSSPAQFDEVRDVVKGVPASLAERLGAVLDAHEAEVPFTDLRGIYDDLGTEQSVFVDWSHVNEDGAAIVAEGIWARIGPSLIAGDAAGD